MGSVMIQNYTCKNPITMIGFEARDLLGGGHCR